jgi:hypothetical protein
VASAGGGRAAPGGAVGANRLTVSAADLVSTEQDDLFGDLGRLAQNQLWHGLPTVPQLGLASLDPLET